MSEVTQYPISGKRASEIAASVERAIERGALQPGDRLPTIRRLAADLAVSPTTVASAIADLRARGLVVSRARSGSTVSWRPPVAGAWLGSAVPVGARDLASGNPDPDLLPSLKPFLRRLEPPGQLYGGEPVDSELLRLAEAEFAEAGIAAAHIAVMGGALEGSSAPFRHSFAPATWSPSKIPASPAFSTSCEPWAWHFGRSRWTGGG